MLDDDVFFVQKWPWNFGEDYPWWKYIQRREPSIRDCRDLESRLTLAESVAFQMKGMYDLKAGDNMMPSIPLAAQMAPNSIRHRQSTGRNDAFC